MQLLSGDQAIAQTRALVVEPGHMAGTQHLIVIEVDPQTRQGGVPQVMAVARAERAVLIDLQRTPGIGAALFEQEPVAAYHAKELHRALMRLGETPPSRWACARLIEQLLQGGKTADLSLTAIAQRAGLSAVPHADAGFDALVERAHSIARLVQRQIDFIKRDGLSWVSRIEAQAIAPIAEMEHHGMSLDAQGWQGALERAQLERDALSNTITAHFNTMGPDNIPTDLFGTSTINLSNDAELKQVLQGLGFAVANVRRQTLSQLPAPLGPQLSRYRELDKLLTSYGKGFLEHVGTDGRLHPTFEQIGASTGRMACHRPNLQAVVKDSEFRDCFACQPDRCLVIADYATCELRILAEMSHDPVFEEAFARGEDLHARVAQTMFDKPVSKTQNADLRQRAKAVNFGLVYGMGAAGLARAIGTDAVQAQALLQQYFRTFPKIGTYLRQAAELGLRQGYAQTLTGRRLYLGNIDDPNSRGQAQRIAKNMPIQGTSADMIKIALGRIRQALAPWPSANIVNVVHDEMIVECACDDAQSVQTTVCQEMRAAGAEILRRTPVEVDSAISRTWNK
ncbi:MAG: DNA polymerase [Myxococcota bacterium]